jgi:hypothetical protein
MKNTLKVISVILIVVILFIVSTAIGLFLKGVKLILDISITGFCVLVLIFVIALIVDAIKKGKK